MIETLTLRCDFDGKRLDRRYEPGIFEYRESGYMRAWNTKKGAIPGVHIDLQDRGGAGLLQAQMTLPTLAYANACAKVGTLEEDKTEAAISLGIKEIRAVLPSFIAREDWHLDVARCDTSVTLSPLGDASETRERQILQRALEMELPKASKNHQVRMYASNGITVYRGQRKGTATPFDRIYQKSPSARNEGFQNVRDGLMRIERERRWGKTGMPLDEFRETGRDVVEIDAEQMANWFMEAQAGYTALMVNQLTLGQKALGEEINASEAVWLSAIQATYVVSGANGVIQDLGISKATVYRRLGRLKQLLEAAPNEEMEKRLYDFFDKQSWFMSADAEQQITKAENKQSKKSQNSDSETARESSSMRAFRGQMHEIRKDLESKMGTEVVPEDQPLPGMENE